MTKKIRKISLATALVAMCCGSLVSCGVDRWKEYEQQTALKSWMYDIMQQHYLWYQGLPAYNNINLFSKPATFLSKVKNSSDSYSFVDSILTVPLPTYGFDYALVRSEDVDTAYNALVTYVIPGSPAAAAGLARGDWIMKVDTSYISKKYEEVLLKGNKARNLVMGEWKEIPAPTEDGTEAAEGETLYKIMPDQRTLSLPAATVVEDTPIHLSKILTVQRNGSDVKVGYLMYSSFTAGTTSEPEKYNNELRRISREFQNEGVSYVILDLRYNAGGSMECARLLGTLLTSANRLNQPMAYLEYNDKNSDKNKYLTFDSNLLKDGVNMDLPGLIVITGSTTAGAAEMLINGLFVNDSYPVVTIGSATKGQNVATERFINEESRWTINPVVCTVYNADRESYGSINPADQLKISETSINGFTNYSEFLPFGHTNERLLKVALSVIDGSLTVAEEENSTETATTNAPLRIEKRFSSPASRRFNAGGLTVK